MNKEEFDKSRNLMIESLSHDIVDNDSIVFIEYFTSVNGNYSVTIYQSNKKRTERYVAKRSIKKVKMYIDSLMLYPNIPDKILDMIRRGNLDEIKKRGDATILPPAATLM